MTRHNLTSNGTVIDAFVTPVDQTGGSGLVVSTGVLHEQNGTFASATTSGLAAVFATTLVAQAAWDGPEVFPFM